MAAVLVACVANGGPVMSRAELGKLLAGQGYLEAFETFPVADNEVAVLDCTLLDSGATCNNQGPGLVVSGVAFTWGSGSGEWVGMGRSKAPSKEILSLGQPLIIDFTDPIQAFGVDLRAFFGYGATAQMAMFAGNDSTLIGTLDQITLLDTGEPKFVGWQDVGGIGRVVLTQTVFQNNTWSPVIDNLEFGNTRASVPEPSALSLVALAFFGLFARRLTQRARR